MKRYVCSVCGFVYDEAKGIPQAGIAPGTRWEALPEDWVCPLCGATKAEFQAQDAAPAAKPVPILEPAAEVKELTPLQVSALCSNLARGCEKQYKPQEAALFTEIAGYYKAAAAPQSDAGFDGLLQLIEADLQTGLPGAHATASAAGDRGALRALVWSEKVTRILNSLLARYAREGDAMLENTGVYVCTICGFIYEGDKLPEVCPVCKVPNWKFEKVEGR
ncbi:MAG: rubredoxin [Eubacteriales bacterium]|nr:rubredoxin [Eubacteriales bacterium]